MVITMIIKLATLGSEEDKHYNKLIEVKHKIHRRYNKENPEMRGAGLVTDLAAVGLSSHNIYNLIKKRPNSHIKTWAPLAMMAPFMAHRLYKEHEIRKTAEIFNPMNANQVSKAAKSFTPGHLASEVKKFHPASTSSNAIFVAESKKEASSGIPTTKWWKKINKNVIA